MATTLFDPTASQSKAEPIRFAPRPRDLKGLKVGLVENTKFNSEKLLKLVAERLRKRYGITLTHLAHKRSSGHAVDDADVREFKTKADFVVAGVGD
ncbi:MAG: hypothetical protein ACHQZQ_00360 [SAR324 cluster bacterium]